MQLQLLNSDYIYDDKTPFEYITKYDNNFPQHLQQNRRAALDNKN